jgi:hypothetical protein
VSAEGNAASRLPPAWATAALLGLLWLLAAPATPDLAAQVYRVGLFASDGFSVWDGNWYGGHHLPGYSLLYPPLGALLGARVVGVAAAIASAALFERIARAHFGERARWGIAWFAAATTADLLIGRLTFSLGVAFGLSAVLALQSERPRLAAGLGVLAAAASPVAGAFAGLAGLTVVIARRDRSALGLALAPLVLVAILSIAFPEGGRQPFSSSAILAVVGFALALAWLLPEHERVLRTGAMLYALAAVAAFLIPTPMGSNATRLGATFAGPLLLCAAAGRGRPGLGRHGVAVVVAAAGMLVWQWWAPVREVAKGATDPSVHAAYYEPLASWLERRGGPPARLEVPFTRGHFEAAHLAPRFALARGWETQLDTKYNGLFYRGGKLTPATYERWLRRSAVRYVAVPDAPLDPAGKQEAALVDRRPAFLTPAARLAHWRIYRLRHAAPLVSGGAVLLSMGPRGFAVQARGPGAILVRVRWTPYWAVRRGAACLRPAPHGWTRLVVGAPGTVRVAAHFTPGRAIARGRVCQAAGR